MSVCATERSSKGTSQEIVIALVLYLLGNRCAIDAYMYILGLLYAHTDQQYGTRPCR